MTAEVAILVENLQSKMPALKLTDLDDETSSCGNHSDGLTLSDSDPKDSGIDCGSSEQLSTPDIPDEETAATIMKTVEFYLSDANILKDPFLLKHVRSNKEGYVSLKLLASFRKVRSLSRNWKAVAHSIQKSNLLALNFDGTKVKRLAPLPDYDETVSSRSVIVYGFSSDKPSVDHVSEMFSQCGDIALVRILRPGGSIPTDVKRFLSKNPEIQSKISALVEFEEHAAARKALETAHPEGISVIPVTIKSNPERPKKSPTHASTTPSKDSPKKKKKNRKASNDDKKTFEEDKAYDPKRNRRSGSMSSQSSGYLSSSPNNNSVDSKYPRRHSFNPSIYNDPNSSFASLGNRHLGSRDRLSSCGTLSPWRRRREQMMQSDSNLVSSGSSASCLLQSLPVKAIRMPRGPDGTNGFGTRGTPRLPSTAE